MDLTWVYDSEACSVVLCSSQNVLLTAVVNMTWHQHPWGRAWLYYGLFSRVTLITEIHSGFHVHRALTCMFDYSVSWCDRAEKENLIIHCMIGGGRTVRNIVESVITLWFYLDRLYRAVSQASLLHALHLVSVEQGSCISTLSSVHLGEKIGSLQWLPYRVEWVVLFRARYPRTLWICIHMTLHV